MADNNDLEQENSAQQGILAEPENPAEATKAPEKSEEQMAAEVAEAEAKAREAEEDPALTRLKYYLKQHGYKNEPDPDICPLIAGIQSQDGKLITVLRDGQTKIVDDGRKIKATCQTLNDTCAHVMASEILAKGWNSIKLGGSAENRQLLAAHILAQNPEAILKGVSITPDLKAQAEMLRKTEYAARQKKEQQEAEKKAPSAEDGGGSAPTSDFPVAGETQKKLEGDLGERAAATTDLIEDKKMRGIPVDQAQFLELVRINNVLESIQKATPEERRVYRNIVDLTVKELDKAKPEEVPGILAKAAELVDVIKESKEKEQATQKPSRKKTGALGPQGIKAAKNLGKQLGQ